MLQYIQNVTSNDNNRDIYKWQIVGVVFDDIPQDDSIPKKLNYRLRTFMGPEAGLLFPSNPYEDDTAGIKMFH